MPTRSRSAPSSSRKTTQKTASDAYRRELEKRLERVAEAALEKWLHEAETAVERTLSAALAQALSSAGTQSVGIGDSGAEEESFLSAFGSSRSSASLVNALSQLLTARLNRKEIRTSSTETTRSQTANAAFRESQSQQQANAAKMAARGQRNL